jgi:ketosteroid isomerase-like protein
LFHVVDGKIELFREYYDPIMFKDAFGLDKGEISNALEK